MRGSRRVRAPTTARTRYVEHRLTWLRPPEQNPSRVHRTGVRMPNASDQSWLAVAGRVRGWRVPEYVTSFGSLDNYQKGSLEIIDDDPKHYTYSNMFEVANASKPWEKVAVAKNM